MIRALETTGIKPVIDCSFALDRIADAFRHQEALFVERLIEQAPVPPCRYLREAGRRS